MNVKNFSDYFSKTYMFVYDKDRIFLQEPLFIIEFRSINRKILLLYQERQTAQSDGIEL